MIYVCPLNDHWATRSWFICGKVICGRVGIAFCGSARHPMVKRQVVSIRPLPIASSVVSCPAEAQTYPQVKWNRSWEALQWENNFDRKLDREGARFVFVQLRRYRYVLAIISLLSQVLIQSRKLLSKCFSSFLFTTRPYPRVRYPF